MVGQPVDSKSTWSYQNYVWWKVESGARNEGKWLEVEADCWQKSGLEVPGLRGSNPNSRKSKLWDGRKKGRSLQRSCVMWLQEGESIFSTYNTMESSEGGRASALQQRLQARREMFLKSESSPAQATPSAQVLEVCLFFNRLRNKLWVLKKTWYIARCGFQVMKICTRTGFCSLLFLAATRQPSNSPLIFRGVRLECKIYDKEKRQIIAYEAQA